MAPRSKAEAFPTPNGEDRAVTLELTPESQRYIFGLKLRKFRQERGWALKDVSKATGLSMSYLSEIEKGRKYPKHDKIVDLARGLGVSYEDLVSTRLDEELRPVRELLASSFLKEFPFHLFGIEPEALVGLVTEVPAKAGALLSTVLELGRTHGVRVEHLLFSALRSYQRLERNQFEEIEKEAEALLAERGWTDRWWIGEEELRELLEEEYGVRVEDEILAEYPDLQGLRSVWIDEPEPALLLNDGLMPPQRAFAVGRELGYRRLGLEERSITSGYINVESFEQVIHDFEAAYFSGCLLIQRRLLCRELDEIFSRRRWDPDAFLELLEKLRTTPETFFYRLSQLVPGEFGLQSMVFLRFANRAGTDHFDLTKILNMSRLPIPLGIEPDEHYCRRWSGLQLLKRLAAEQASGAATERPSVGIQRARFLEDGSEFLTFTLTRPLALSDDENTSVNVSFRIDDELMRRIHFWDDPEIPRRDVGLTCERCGLADCAERVAPPVEFEAQETRRRQEAALDQLLERMRG